MRWETTVWMSAALVVATSALHLTIDHDLLGEQSQTTSTTSSAVKQSEQDRIEHTTPTNSNEKDASVSRSAEKTSIGNDGRTPAELEGAGGGNSGDDQNGGNGGSDGGSNDGNDSGGNGGSEGGSNDGNEGGGNDGPEGGSNDGNEGGGNGGSEGGSNDGNEGGGNDGPEGGSNDGNEGGGNGGSEGGSNDGNEGGGNGGSEGGSNDGNEGGGNDGSEGGSNDGNEDGENGGSGGNDDQLIVTTTTGSVQGYAWGEKADIISYIDIKYGTFQNPFEAPVLATASEDIHKVKEHDKRCPQLENDEYVGDTECLTLSIFKPLDATSAGVLVHIHEGNFINGSADPNIYGPEYLVAKGIILVLPNYRLGPLGFLCLQNETAPGNAALKDLTLALSWVKTNIAQFGGNPENIAVSGDGTAGALAGYLALSPLSKDSISKVITESGSVLAHWALDRNPIVAATHIVNKINQFSTWQGIDISTLVTAANDVVLRPCLENNSGNGAFMVDTPSAMMEDQEIKIKFMIGSAKYAGAHEYIKHATDVSIQQLNNDVGLLLPNDLQFETTEEKNRLGNKVKNLYFGEADINKDQVERLSQYFTDSGYLSPGIRTARPLVNSGATVYFYEFSFVGTFNRELNAIALPDDIGPVRGDIIGYLFTQGGVVPDEDTKEMRMVDILTEMWTTFINTGTPSAANIVWNKLEKTNDTEEEWLSIEEVPSTKTGLYVNRLSLWTDIYNQYFIERNLAFVTSPSVFTVLVLQFTFFVAFFRNASHFF